MNLVSFLEKGSTKPAIQADILRVFQAVRKAGVFLTPVHLRREDPRIQVADAGSKWIDTDDWSVDLFTFNYLSGMMQRPADIDLFADTVNARAGLFASRYVCPRTFQVDAFALDWSGYHAWICPPTLCLVDVVKKILVSSHLTGILIAPVWQSAPFWPFLVPDGVHLASCFNGAFRFRPYLLNSETGNDAGSFWIPAN